MLGGLAASGWHTCCLMMRMAVDGFAGNSSSMGAPGVDEVKWLKPLRPGTALTLRRTVLDTRISASRPDRGFVRMLWEALDDNGEVLATLSASMIMGRRGAGAP
jgi:acyl dehydratase